MDKWISVKEQLPNDGDPVLVVVYGKYKNIEFKGAYELATYSEPDNDWILDAYPEAEDITVTHWLSLPEPPEEVRRECTV